MVICYYFWSALNWQLTHLTSSCQQTSSQLAGIQSVSKRWWSPEGNWWELLTCQWAAAVISVWNELESSGLLLKRGSKDGQRNEFEAFHSIFPACNLTFCWKFKIFLLAKRGWDSSLGFLKHIIRIFLYNWQFSRKCPND